MPKVKFMRHAKTTLNKENIFAGRTHAGVLRQVRDNFLPDMNKGIIKN